MPSIRVASFNISGGITSDKRFYSKRGTAQCSARLEQARSTMLGVADLLDEQGIEIAALQEVDTCYSGDERLDQADFLAQRLGASYRYLPLFEYHLGRHTNVRTGLSTLSRSTIRSHTKVGFQQLHGSWARKAKARLLGAKGALHTVHEIEGQVLHVVNAHLTHDLDAQKECELETLLDYCSHLDPAILLGDFNTTPRATRSAAMSEGRLFGSDQCMQILATFARKNAGLLHSDQRLCDFADKAPQIREVCTYPAGRESFKLDYCIGFSRKSSFALSPETILSSALSNHSATSVVVSW